MTLSTAQLDRACGVLLGTAAGDALGAAYEFGPPRGPEQEVAMVGGGAFGWEPGEWTDDTSMAIAIAEVAATGADLRDEEALDAIAQRWHDWSHDAKDVGVQTRSVLSRAGRRGISAQTAREESAGLHKLTGRTAGNGSLMRTAPLALAYLDDEAALVEAARLVSELTHYDPEAGEACVLWCLAIRHAILTGVLDARIGLQHIDAERRDLWASRLNIAEASKPSDFANNGWVVEALQGAWSAIATTPVPQDEPAKGVFRADHLRLALDTAVRGGWGHRHSGSDCRRAAWRCLRGVGSSRRVASNVAWLARLGDTGSGSAVHPNREGGASAGRVSGAARRAELPRYRPTQRLKRAPDHKTRSGSGGGGFHFTHALERESCSPPRQRWRETFQVPKCLPPRRHHNDCVSAQHRTKGALGELFGCHRPEPLEEFE